jgi:hypothetical protein
MNTSETPARFGNEYTDGGRRNEGFTHETNDCTVRAVAIACNVPYTQAHVELARRGRKDGKGIAMRATVMKDPVFCGKRLVPVFDMMKNNGKCICLVTARKMFPKGRYTIVKSGHAFALVDGVDHDLSGNSKWIMVKIMWRVEEVAQGTSEAM